MCKVSVVMPVYNTSKYLRECLDSVLDQTLKDIEVICVDDGSTDDSLAVLYEYANKDSRIKIIKQKNQYAGVARNNGMKVAKGKYIIFLDSDDIFENKMLEKMYHVATRKNLDIVVCRSNQFDAETYKLKETPWTIREQLLPDKDIFSALDVKKEFFNLFVWWPWDKLYKKSFIDRLGIQFSALRTTNDLFFVAGTVASASRISCINEVLVHHRINNCNSLENTRDKSWDCFYYALNELAGFLKNRGLFEKFKYDFLNYCLEFSFWQYDTLHGPKRYILRHKLCNEWFKSLGVDSLEELEIYNTELFDRKTNLMKQDKVFKRTISNDSPKITIVIPCLNSMPYVTQCIESVIEQTISDIEIICVDAGSKDGTLELIKGYQTVDPRIIIIHSDKKSYGYQMNLGFKAAKGEYIGLVESDDFAEPTMFKKLYTLAKNDELDLAKSGFFNYCSSENGPKNLPVNIPANAPDGVFEPLSSSFIESQQFFQMSPSIWTGLYKADFIRNKNIRFNETAGASYQDTAFTFKVWCCAKRVRFLNECLLHYRRDNDNSSSNSKGKIYCLADEYKEEERFLAEEYPEIKKRAEGIRCRLKYAGYLWNYRRLSTPYNLEFLRYAANEFAEDMSKGYFEKKYFSQNQWEELNCIIDDCKAYHAVSKEKFNPIDRINIMKNIIAFNRKRKSLSGDNKFRELVKNKQSTPLLSIIIPVYNTSQYIRECLKSVIEQSLKNIEIICVDDGSTDASLSILLEYAHKDSRISIYTQNNSGQSVARNNGIKVANGEYVQFLDSDDLLLPESLTELTDRMVRDNLDIVYFDADSFNCGSDEFHINQYTNYYNRKRDYKGLYTGRELMDLFQKFHEYRVSPCLQLLRLSFLRENTISFLEGVIHEDNAFTFKSMFLAKRVGYIHKSYYARRLRSGSVMTSKVSWNNAYGYFKCFIEMYEFIKNIPDKDISYEALSIVSSVCRNGRAAYASLPLAEKRISLALSQQEQILLTICYEDWASIRWKTVLDYNKRCKKLQFDFDCMRNSISFRIGRVITWLPRKIRGGIWCLRDHGVVYTVKRMIEHIGMDMGTGDYRR